MTPTSDLRKAQQQQQQQQYEQQYEQQQRRGSTGTTSSSRKLYLDGSMDEDIICEYLDIAKSKLRLNHLSSTSTATAKASSSFFQDEVAEYCTTLTLDEIYISSTIAASIVELFQHYNVCFRSLERLQLEFCEGSRDEHISLVTTSALTLNCVKHMFLASDDATQQSKLMCSFGTLLRINTSMTSLWLLLPLRKTAAHYIGTGLAHNIALEKFSLSGCSFENERSSRNKSSSANEIVRSKSCDSNPTTYITSDDDDDDDGNDHDTRQSMQHLVPPAAVALAEGLKMNSHLKSLDISCCYLNDATMNVLLKGIKYHPTLESLGLSGNYCRNKSVQTLSAMLEYNYTNIRSIDLREQTMVRPNEDDEEPTSTTATTKTATTPLDISLLAQSLKINDTLETLKLSSNGLTDEQVLELATCLSNNSTLSELDLQWNCITDVGVHYFTDALKQNHYSGLQVLLLGGNSIGKDGVNVLDQLGDDDDSICTIHQTPSKEQEKSNTMNGSSALQKIGHWASNAILGREKSRSKLFDVQTQEIAKENEGKKHA